MKFETTQCQRIANTKSFISQQLNNCMWNDCYYQLLEVEQNKLHLLIKLSFDLFYIHSLWNNNGLSVRNELSEFQFGIFISTKMFRLIDRNRIKSAFLTHRLQKRMNDVFRGLSTICFDFARNSKFIHIRNVKNHRIYVLLECQLTLIAEPFSEWFFFTN